MGVSALPVTMRPAVYAGSEFSALICHSRGNDACGYFYKTISSGLETHVTTHPVKTDFMNGHRLKNCKPDNDQ